MSAITWTKFFWADWETDPALRLCSYAAQGLWMRMLCIASAHDPIGYVAVAGRALDPTAIARMTGGSEGEVQTLLAELDRNGVFSRDRNGRIYSRRMIRDARRSADARKNGKKGGNPSLGNTEGISQGVNPRDKGGDKPQKPEARSQNEETEAIASVVAQPSKVVWDDVFEMAWKAYPHHPGRSASRKQCWPVWREQVRLCGDALRLLRAVETFARFERTKPTEAGAKAFERWLKDGRWEHWIEGEATPSNVAVFPDAKIRAAVEHAKGEAFCASWLDPCAWDAEHKAIIPRTNFAAAKLKQEVGHVLRELGVSIEERAA